MYVRRDRLNTGEQGLRPSVEQTIVVFLSHVQDTAGVFKPFRRHAVLRRRVDSET